jgi:type II secretory pathway pseudopilin PulG
VVSAIAALIAIVVSIAFPLWSDRRQRRVQQEEAAKRQQFEKQQQLQREEFERRQADELARGKKQLAELESSLRTQESIRQKRLAELSVLGNCLAGTLAAFEALISESENGSNDGLVAAVKAALPHLSELQGLIDGITLTVKPRHRRELEQFETFLIELFLDVRRPRGDRADATYREEIARYRQILETYESRARWLLEIILSGAAVRRFRNGRVRRAPRRGSLEGHTNGGGESSELRA